MERSLTAMPLPIADAVAGLSSAESVHEERDRVVEVFRAVLRVLATLLVATRLHVGAGPDETRAEVEEAFRLLRRRRPTDGQWLALSRAVAHGWASSPSSHPLPSLIALFTSSESRAEELLDELLAMRKSETIAHGGTGDDQEVEALLCKRVPQLAALLTALEPLFSAARIVAPLAAQPRSTEPQRARLLMGATPPRGRFRRIALAPGSDVLAGEPIVIDETGRPIVALTPLMELRRAAPGAAEELFVLDGHSRAGTAYVALPSMAEYVDRGAWTKLDRALFGEPGDEAEEPARGERPYRGLERFGPEHAELFFGREEEADALANRVRREPLLTVTGPSGSGKSSLVAAGVLPRLTDFAHVIVRPGASPTAALARRIVERLGEETDEDAVREILRRRPDVAASALARWCSEHRTSLVIVIDQAEELLTLASSTTDCLAFAEMIAALSADPSGPLRVVLIVREDFFARLSSLAPLRGLYTRAVDVVTTPDRDALTRAVVLPLARFGYTFEDSSLVEAMVDAAAGEPAALALLSFCADRLWSARDRRWRRISRETYEAVGGVESALAQHADHTLADLTPLQRACARDVLLRLVTPSMARAVVPRADLLAATGRPDDARIVVERLVEARLLVAREGDPSGEGASLELVHEALLKHWQLLRGWLDEDRERQSRRASLREAARAWQERGRPRALLLRDEILSEMSALSEDASISASERALLDQSSLEQRRASRARRAASALVLATCLLVAAALVFAFRTALRERARAEEAARSARHALLSAEVGRLTSEAGRRELLGRPAEALALLRAAASEADDARSITPEIDRLVSLGDAPRTIELGRSPIVVGFARAATFAIAGRQAFAFDAEGHEISRSDLGGESAFASVSTDRFAVAFADRRVAIFDFDGRNPVISLPLEAMPSSLSLSANGARAVVGLVNGSLLVIDVARGRANAVPVLDNAVSSVAISGDGRLAAALGATGAIAIVDTESGALVGTVPRPSSALLSLAFRGRALVIVDRRAVRSWQDGALTVLDPSASAPTAASVSDLHLAIARADGSISLRAGDTERRFVAPGRPVHRVTVSADGRILAGATADGAVTIWDIASGARLSSLRSLDAPDAELFLDRAGTTLLSASPGEDVALTTWSLRSTSRGLAGHQDDVHAVAISSNGTRLVTSSRDHTARLWSLPSGAPIATLEHGDQVDSAAFSPDGSLVATGSHDRRVRVFAASDGALLHTLEPFGGYLPSVAFSPRGNELVAASVDRSLRLFDSSTGALTRSLGGSDAALVSVAFDPEGRSLVAIGDDDTARFWLETGAPSGRLAVPSGYAEAVSTSTIADTFAVGGLDGSALVARISTGERVARVFGHDGAVLATAVSDDGATLVTGSSDQTARIWSLPEGNLRATLEGHTGRVLAVAVSNDLVATGSADRSVRVWTREGKLVAVLGGHSEEVTAVAFTPDGLHVVSSSRDDTARISRVDASHDPARASLEAGRLTNLRVCPATLVVIAVKDAAPDSVWAPSELCHPSK